MRIARALGRGQAEHLHQLGDAARLLVLGQLDQGPLAVAQDLVAVGVEAGHAIDQARAHRVVGREHSRVDELAHARRRQAAAGRDALHHALEALVQDRVERLDHLGGSDFLVVGAGIAGASAGYWLSESGRVTVLEMESAPGYHSTGRSAALFSEYYGNRMVRAITAASRPFFTAPPPGFAAAALTPRGVVALGPLGAEDKFAEVLAAGLTAPIPVREIGPGEARRHCPVVRTGGTAARCSSPPRWTSTSTCSTRDSSAASGPAVATSSARPGYGADQARRGLAGDDRAGEFAAEIVVNAAGAWADEVATAAGVAPVGLVPLRRTALTWIRPRASGWPGGRWWPT